MGEDGLSDTQTLASVQGTGGETRQSLPPPRQWGVVVEKIPLSPLFFTETESLIGLNLIFN